MISCSQHDARSAIAEQRMTCEGKVVVIPYEAFDEWGNKVSSGLTTVCEAHMPSFEARRLESHGYRLGQPREIGVTGESSLLLPPDLEHEH